MKNTLLASIFLVLFYASAHGQAPKWIDYPSREHHFTMSFPGTPSATKQYIDAKQGTRYTFTVNASDGVYLVMVSDGPAFAGAHTDSQLKVIYDGGRDGALANLEGSHLLMDRDIKEGGIPAREIIIANDKYLAKTRYVITRDRLFTMLVLIDRSRQLDTPTLTNMTKFLDSFRVN